jgi:Transcriptional regulator/sugar kinase
MKIVLYISGVNVMDNQTRRNERDSTMQVHDVYRLKSLPGARGADLHSIREFNRLLILNYLREHGPAARVVIARHLGLSRTTISSIIDILMDEGLVYEGQRLEAAPQGGRRATLVHFEEDAGQVIGVDIGRGHLTVIIANLAATITAQKTLPFNTSQGAKRCIQQVIEQIRLFASETELSWNRVIGIGIAIPGPLDITCHRVNKAPHMPGWEQIDLWQLLQQEFHIPIWIDRDANMGAIGEYRGGAGRDHANLAYIKIGTGIGSGLLLNGCIYRGHSGSAGEVGHLTLQEQGALCSCGNRGCLETIAAVPVIIADAEQGYSLAQRRSNAKGSIDPVEQRYQVVQVQPKENIAAVLQAARAGEAASLAALEQAGTHIGIALAGLINIFNPSAIIIDSSIARPGEIFLQALERSAAASCLPSAWEGTQILTGSLGLLSVALGAIYTVIDATFTHATDERSR